MPSSAFIMRPQLQKYRRPTSERKLDAQQIDNFRCLISAAATAGQLGVGYSSQHVSGLQASVPLPTLVKACKAAMYASQHTQHTHDITCMVIAEWRRASGTQTSTGQTRTRRRQRRSSRSLQKPMMFCLTRRKGRYMMPMVKVSAAMGVIQSYTAKALRALPACPHKAPCSLQTFACWCISVTLAMIVCVHGLGP